MQVATEARGQHGLTTHPGSRAFSRCDETLRLRNVVPAKQRPAQALGGHKGATRRGPGEAGKGTLALLQATRLRTKPCSPEASLGRPAPRPPHPEGWVPSLRSGLFPSLESPLQP